MLSKLSLPVALAVTGALFAFSAAHAQNGVYTDSIVSFQQNYINTHEVVTGTDRKFISFYPVSRQYEVIAAFKKKSDTTGFEMNTSSGMKKKYFVYGMLTFTLHDTLLHVYIYQSETLMRQEKYKDYLFVPFVDATSGYTSYGGGRYLDFTTGDIKNNQMVMDFNKAYNPYCAYTSGYNCPIPPKENLVTVAIYAGEKNYGKPYH